MHTGYSEQTSSMTGWTYTSKKNQPIVVEHITSPLDLKEGWFNPLTRKTKWGVGCGCCHRFITTKLKHVNRLAVLCHHCDAMNIWTYERWQKGGYQKRI